MPVAGDFPGLVPGPGNLGSSRIWFGRIWFGRIWLGRFGLAAFGLAAFGLAIFGLAVFGLAVFCLSCACEASARRLMAISRPSHALGHVGHRPSSLVKARRVYLVKNLTTLFAPGDQAGFFECD